MITFKVLVNGVDISNYTGGLSWADTLDTLGVEVNFTVAREFVDNIKLGDSIILMGDNTPYFYGVVVSRNISLLTTDITAFDFAWYLNKSTVLKQFKGVVGNECIKALCQDVGINVEVSSADVVIDHIYKDMTVIEVIEDILTKATQQHGKRFSISMIKDKLVIKPYEKIKIKGQHSLKENDFIDVSKHIGNINYSDSIENLKNSVLVLSGDEQATRHEGSAEDGQNIERYGKLQEVVTLDSKDFINAQNVAKTKLKELNKIEQSISLEILGDITAISGKIINLDIPSFNLQGDYLIKSSEHSVDNRIYKTVLTVEEVEKVE